MQRILIIRFSSLGDVILLSALLDALKVAHPKAELWLATKQAFAPLFAEDWRVHRLVALDAGAGSLGRLRAQLETTRFDLILDAHGSLRSRALCWRLPPAPIRRIAKDTAARLLFVGLRRRSRALARHQLDRYLDLIGSDSGRWRPSLMLSEKDRLDAQRVFARAAATGENSSPEGAPAPGNPLPRLAIAPGSRHVSKQWPLDRFADVARRFQEANMGEILLLGGPGEEEACEAVARQLPRPALVSSGEQPLRRSAALLEACELLLCNDSGLMHMAEAVGTPALSIFGPTSRELGYFPRDPLSRVVEHALDCRPCSRNGRRACRLSEQLCMTRSTVDLVFSHLESRWRRIRYQSHAASI